MRSDLATLIQGAFLCLAVFGFWWLCLEFGPVIGRLVWGGGP